jgi:hypothetical protein
MHWNNAAIWEISLRSETGNLNRQTGKFSAETGKLNRKRAGVARLFPAIRTRSSRHGKFCE